MKLYDRDYSKYTKEEEVIINELEQKYNNPHGFGHTEFGSIAPKAYRCKRSIFPNNYLDFVELNNDFDRLHKINENFYKMLQNNKISEQDIQKFIKENKAYHIIGSLTELYGYDWEFEYKVDFCGHHGAYLFPEFKLGTSYAVDYLLVCNASGGHQFVFIELENPYGNIFLEDGNFGETFRKGLNQINDWDNFIASKFSIITAEFEKCTTADLPREFYNGDPTRYHYVVIAGRRTDFEENREKTYRLARNELKKRNTLVIHYDKLYEQSEKLITKIGNYTLTY